MGGLIVDLEMLGVLQGTVSGLTGEASALRVGPAGGPFVSGTGGVPGAVLTASEVSAALVDGALLSSVRERLSETAEIIGHIAAEYRTRDEAASADLAARFSAATGEWV